MGATFANAGVAFGVYLSAGGDAAAAPSTSAASAGAVGLTAAARGFVARFALAASSAEAAAARLGAIRKRAARAAPGKRRDAVEEVALHTHVHTRFRFESDIVTYQVTAQQYTRDDVEEVTKVLKRDVPLEGFVRGAF